MGYRTYGIESGETFYWILPTDKPKVMEKVYTESEDDILQMASGNFFETKQEAEKFLEEWIKKEGK